MLTMEIMIWLAKNFILTSIFLFYISHFLDFEYFIKEIVFFKLIC